jgi:hypothetical protein
MPEEKTIQEKMQEYENIILTHDTAVLDVKLISSEFETLCNDYVAGKDISHDAIISKLNHRKEVANSHTAIVVRKNLLEQELAKKLDIAAGTMPIVAYIHKALNKLSK